MSPTHQRVLEALHYDPETGVFTWRVRRSNRIQAGDLAGGPSSDGTYWAITLDGHETKAHIWAWFWMTGTWPGHHIDHIDGDTLNNRFANLRDEPRTTNMRNIVAPQKNNTSGFRGVTRKGNRWSARITVNSTTRYLGAYPTPEEASAAYWAAKAEHHGAETYQGRLNREEK